MEKLAFHVEEQCNRNGKARNFKLCSGSSKWFRWCMKHCLGRNAVWADWSWLYTQAKEFGFHLIRRNY